MFLPSNLTPPEVADLVKKIELDFINKHNHIDPHIFAIVVPIVRNILSTHCRFKYPLDVPFISFQAPKFIENCQFPKITRRNKDYRVIGSDSILIFHHNSDPNRIGHIKKLKDMLNDYCPHKTVTIKNLPKGVVDKNQIEVNEFFNISHSLHEYSSYLYQNYSISLNLHALKLLILDRITCFLNNYSLPILRKYNPSVLFVDNFVESSSISLFIAAQYLAISHAEVLHASTFDSRYLFVPFKSKFATSVPDHFLCLDQLSSNFARKYISNIVLSDSISQYQRSNTVKRQRFLTLCGAQQPVYSNLDSKNIYSSKIDATSIAIALGGGFEINHHTPKALLDELNLLQEILLDLLKNKKTCDFKLLPHPRKHYSKELPTPLVSLIKSHKLFEMNIAKTEDFKDIYNNASYIIFTFGTSAWKDYINTNKKIVFLSDNSFNRFIQESYPNIYIINNVPDLFLLIGGK